MTQVVDPTYNWTNVYFQPNSGNFYETERDIYRGTSTLVQTIYTCYNGSPAPCYSTAITLPITQRAVTLQWPSGLQSKTVTSYDSTYTRITEVDEYGYDGALARKTLTSYANLSGIYNRPQTVTVQDGSGNIGAQTTYGYDTHGNPTSISQLVRSGASLSRSFTYNSNGTLATATDVNGAVTSYGYGGAYSCNGAFPTSVTEPLGLTRSETWNCWGGVLVQDFDENGQFTQTNWLDPYFWRPSSTVDRAGYATYIYYNTPAQNQTTSRMTFNSNGSVVENLTTLDTLGRVHVSQRRQGPGASNYDSVTTGYDQLGRASFTSIPYSNSSGQPYTGSGTSTAFDALGRPATVTDAGGGTVGYMYSSNDVLQTLGPATTLPAVENTKQKQLEYDALGRLTSVCELTSTANGGGTCGQTSAVTGYWTKYTYDVLGDLLTVKQNAQSGSPQSRTYTYDDLGRITSETNPESGQTTYTYDSDATCGTYNGDLVKRRDAVGNVTCYAYDALHRVTGVTYPTINYPTASTPTKTFVYDVGSASGFNLSNTKGRLAEAYTGPSNNKTTDLVFTYSARGEVTGTWESTPHSTMYHQVAGSWWANGALNTLTTNDLPWITYTPDPEGRPNQVSSSYSIVSSTQYNLYASPPQVTVSFASGDSDVFQYDPNTGRMTQYKFNIGSSSSSGSLTWNANGTLQQNVIVDPFNAANQQNCTYAHDDLARIASVNCQYNQAPVWAQSFSFDPFGNIQKTGNATFSVAYDTTKNQVAGGQGFSYDLNGNTTQDNAHAYSWDVEGKPVGIDTISLTYDALGRMVEQNLSGYTQIAYGLDGSKLALFNGATLLNVFLPLPQGAVAESPSNQNYTLNIRHPDWLGSSRITSDKNHNVTSDLAYAPYGETYAELNGTPDRSFTGQNQDTLQSGTAGAYDFLYREYAQYGRWISPDLAGIGAVNPGSPQMWNRYGYVANNPLRAIDPWGLMMCLTHCPNWDTGAGEPDMLPLDPALGPNDTYLDGTPTPISVANTALHTGAAFCCAMSSGFITLYNADDQELGTYAFVADYSPNGDSTPDGYATYSASYIGYVDPSWFTDLPVYTPLSNTPLLALPSGPFAYHGSHDPYTPQRPPRQNNITGPHPAPIRNQCPINTPGGPPCPHTSAAFGIGGYSAGSIGPYPGGGSSLPEPFCPLPVTIQALSGGCGYRSNE